MKIYHKKEKDFNEFAKVNVPEEGVELGEEDAAIFNDGIREVERVILLKVIDSKWMNHIDDMDQLRDEYRTSVLCTEGSGCSVQVPWI